MKVSKFFLLCMIGVSIGVFGCSKSKGVKGDESANSLTDQNVSQHDVDAGRADSDSGNAGGLQTINFPFDSSEIVGENRERLNQNIAILKQNPGMNIQIEGHCDEKGGIQYNLGLGERRAKAVVQQLVLGGIAKKRTTTISMGKEKPLVQGSSEEAWAKNRRGNFVVTAK